MRATKPRMRRASSFAIRLSFETKDTESNRTAQTHKYQMSTRTYSGSYRKRPKRSTLIFCGLVCGYRAKICTSRLIQLGARPKVVRTSLITEHRFTACASTLSLTAPHYRTCPVPSEVHARLRRARHRARRQSNALRPLA